jgi:hypothetical protein
MTAWLNVPGGLGATPLSQQRAVAIIAAVITYARSTLSSYRSFRRIGAGRWFSLVWSIILSRAPRR